MEKFNRITKAMLHLVKNLLFLLLLSLLASCTSQKSTDNSSLPVLNIAEDDYPTRKIDIHDIADVEYIPLESSDSTLVGQAYIYISDKYVVTSDFATGGNIYFFDHSGKLLWKFNNRGSGPGEFSYLGLEIVDFESEECYVNDFNKRMLYVYSFKGDYKRTMSLQGMGEGLQSYTAFSVRNYDKDFLLGYDDAAVIFIREIPNRAPYYLINKKDGSRHALDLKIRNGLTNQIYNDKGDQIGSLTHFSILHNGDECWISELSCDTIYSLKEKRLVPIAVQSPSAHSTNPLIIFPFGFTDYFFVFNVAKMSMDKKYPRIPKDSKELVWNRLSNQLEQWEFYNSDFMVSDNSINIPVVPYGGVMKNCGMMFYGPEALINCHKKGVLKGRLNEIAPRLREDDNNVVALIKYNKEKILKVLTQSPQP